MRFILYNLGQAIKVFLEKTSVLKYSDLYYNPGNIISHVPLKNDYIRAL